MISMEYQLNGSATLAKELGVNRVTLWRVRTGRRTSARLAKALMERGIVVEHRENQVKKERV